MFFLSTFCVSHTYADTKGGFDITDNTGSSVYTYNSGVLTIESGDVTLSTPQQTGDRIVIGTTSTTGEVNVHLNGVNIQTGSGPAIQIMLDATFDVNVELFKGTQNELSTTAFDASAIQKGGSDYGKGTGNLNIFGEGNLVLKSGSAEGIGAPNVEASKYLYNVHISDCFLRIELLTNYFPGIGVDAFNSGSFTNFSLNNAKLISNGYIGSNLATSSDLSFDNCDVSIYSKYLAPLGGYSLDTCTINNSKICAYGSSACGCAGIGGSQGESSPATGAAKNVHISDSIVYAYGGAGGSLTGSGIGGCVGAEYSGVSSGNSISGNSLVYAASGGSSCPALMGFDTSGLTGGMVFEGVVTNYTDDPFENPYTVSWNKGTIYGETTLSKDMSESLELPVTTTIDKNATFKVANDSKLTIPNTMSLQNDGKLDSLKNITIANGGSITTANNFYLKDQTTPSTSNYATYLTSKGVVENYTNVPALPENYIHGWFSNKDGTGTLIYNGKPVELNLHNFYEVESDAYLINAPSVENGTIALDKNYAFQGEKVSFTLSPDEGYRVGEVTVTTEDGKTIQLEEAGNTYSFSMPASEVTIHVIFSEGAGEDSPVVIESPEHGTITADKDKAKEGDSVSFTVSPDEGYELKAGSLTITDSEGNSIDYTVKDGIYSFIMPSTGVFISAVFEPIATPKEGWELDDTGWRYFVDNDAITGWRWIDDAYGAHWYFFGDDTYMVSSSWLYNQDTHSWYWVCSTGPMITKLWQWIDNEWYGFYWDGKMCQGWVWDTDWNAWFYCYQNGIMARSTWVDAYWVDWRGVWLH